jgi:hypothetical protein
MVAVTQTGEGDVGVRVDESLCCIRASVRVRAVSDKKFGGHDWSLWIVRIWFCGCSWTNWADAVKENDRDTNLSLPRLGYADADIVDLDNVCLQMIEISIVTVVNECLYL